ncbi:MAG: DNA mismatch repair endonuclease MutL [bacterium]
MGETAGSRESPPGICVLSDAVINKIAAGEVVERPASVVKELMENALDAGAGNISVTLAEGGKNSITVLDNGWGMGEADAELSIQRHATSKIRDESELASIVTLGFRGEALASIAAVSRFEMTTCADEQAGGLRLEVEGGRVVSKTRIGFPRGTKIVVEDLFGNTPARKKFLRGHSTEFQHVQTFFTQLALGHPGVRFRLTHNRRLVHDLPRCGTLHERVYQVFGREMSDGLIAVAGSESSLGFDGLISHPSHSRGSRRWQYLMLNGRPIRDTRINHAVYQAYRTLLMKGRHPAYFLNLRIEPEEVDVNVHPTKTEVRLRNPQLVHTVFSRHIHSGLKEATRREIWPGEAVSSVLAPGRGQSPTAGAGADQLREPTLPAGQALSAWEHPAAAMPAPFRGRKPDTSEDGPLFSMGVTFPHQGPASAEHPFSSDAFHFQPLTSPAGGDAPEPAAGLIEEDISVLSQFHATYILAQRRDSLVLVDQHAAHERILFENIRLQYYDKTPLSETYLIPLTLELSTQNALLLEQYLPQWNQLGFEIEPFGRNAFQVRQVPGLLSGKDIEALVLEVLDELALFGKSGRLEEAINGIMERIACHSAIRAGMQMSREEMEALLSQLKGMDVNLYCPHGRPVWIEITLPELEKRFKRIV